MRPFFCAPGSHSRTGPQRPSCTPVRKVRSSCTLRRIRQASNSLNRRPCLRLSRFLAVQYVKFSAVPLPRTRRAPGRRSDRRNGLEEVVA